MLKGPVFRQRLIFQKDAENNGFYFRRKKDFVSTTFDGRCGFGLRERFYHGGEMKNGHILDADATRPSTLRKLGNIQISLRLRALRAGRLNVQNCDLIFSRTLS
jgi:hypothetical protein